MTHWAFQNLTGGYMLSSMEFVYLLQNMKYNYKLYMKLTFTWQFTHKI